MNKYDWWRCRICRVEVPVLLLDAMEMLDAWCLFSVLAPTSASSESRRLWTLERAEDRKDQEKKMLLLYQCSNVLKKQREEKKRKSVCLYVCPRNWLLPKASRSKDWMDERRQRLVIVYEQVASTNQPAYKMKWEWTNHVRKIRPQK